MKQRILLRARLLWPVSQPVVEDGAVLVEGGVIQAVGRWAELRSAAGDEETEDLGDVVLLPGLVNAHCHLDYTGMAGMIPPPSAFADWVKSLLPIKAHWAYSEFADSWVAGAGQLLRSGVTTVADIEAVPELLPEAWRATPLRVVSLLEMTGVRSARRPDLILAEAMRRVEELGVTEFNCAGLSPHALYSTPPELLRLTGEVLRARGLPCAIHLAESAEEFDMYRHGRGPLYDWLKAQRSMDDCGHGSPVRQAWQCGLLQPGLMAVHVNYLAEGDAQLLAESGAHVVHCPQSHDYFRHQPFEHAQLARAGVNICLGTDSLASTRLQQGRKRELSLWDEMKLFAEKHPETDPAEIFAMATINAGRALRRSVGQLASGSPADLIAVPLSTAAEKLAEALVHGRPQPAKVWIAGRPALDRPG